MSRGLTPFAQQAKEKASRIVAAVEDRIQQHQQMLTRFEPESKGAIRFSKVIERAEEDLRGLLSYIEEINTPIEESGLKKTAYMTRQRELGNKILEYNRRYNTITGTF